MLPNFLDNLPRSTRPLDSEPALREAINALFERAVTQVVVDGEVPTLRRELDPIPAGTRIFNNPGFLDWIEQQAERGLVRVYTLDDDFEVWCDGSEALVPNQMEMIPPGVSVGAFVRIIQRNLRRWVTEVDGLDEAVEIEHAAPGHRILALVDDGDDAGDGGGGGDSSSSASESDSASASGSDSISVSISEPSKSVSASDDSEPEPSSESWSESSFSASIPAGICFYYFSAACDAEGKWTVTPPESGTYFPPGESPEPREWTKFDGGCSAEIWVPSDDSASSLDLFCDSPPAPPEIPFDCCECDDEFPGCSSSSSSESSSSGSSESESSESESSEPPAPCTCPPGMPSTIVWLHNGESIQLTRRPGSCLWRGTDTEGQPPNGWTADMNVELDGCEWVASGSFARWIDGVTVEGWLAGFRKPTGLDPAGSYGLDIVFDGSPPSSITIE